ncbi:RNA polymerase sigma-70 factor (ECF subfamily) [Mobilisporobacter senegalensis]|uniref:RNA polymerase sigma-70 factor (ECF subfamily) n=1 Tax=Mobilisporobacter senegalensis TaxID=1329262 RepID=A0A3N1XM46_9FIRM|nr:sigma-70 family RNA polymerase sigma factor [Mobilisporobacter senegalensis]ROR27248.1 RNA polymerase sigma-70 factor (ECF subfamily) [Mobilisporobacter senegalensis]
MVYNGAINPLEQLIKTYSNMLLKIAFTYVKNTADAEDIVQDVFVKVFEKNPDFTSEEHRKAWLIRSTINKAKNYLSSSIFRKNVPLDEELSYLPKEESSVLGAVMNLPAKYRLVIHLYYYEGYSAEEIALTLGKRSSTIRTQLQRGRALLKQELKGEW